MLLGSVPHGRDRASAVAAKLGAGILADVMDIEPQDGGVVYSMSVFGGATNTKCRIRGTPQIICVKPNAFVAEESPAEATEERIEAQVSDEAQKGRTAGRGQQGARRRPAGGGAWRRRRRGAGGWRPD